MSDIAEVMQTAGQFAATPDRHAGADVIAAVCGCLGMDRKQRNRTLDSFMGAPRKRIRFSEARRMLGLTDARSWYRRCKRDQRFDAIKIMHDTKTHPYVWEDEVLAVLAELNTGEES
ncbi:MAG: hypothetical protein DRI46_11340 [Chloroflexi bacterium]|nr:MAG: hypothetical protein DRI46_11340 [Chloroflexota bacterium]